MSELRVWVNSKPSGTLSRERGEYLFNYLSLSASDAVSLTMPVRSKSYVSESLFPIFEMHLPEGYLLSVIKKHFSKLRATDDFGLLSLLSSKVTGRLAYAEAMTSETSLTLDEILHSGEENLFNSLVQRFALSSAVSGVQPKVLALLQDKATLQLSHYIVKSWGADYPNLALNEWLCMKALEQAGLEVPEFYLSDDERCFVMKRFDITEQGDYLGFEDFCVLQAKSRDDKYRGSYEQLAKSIATFVSPKHRKKGLYDFFKAMVLNQWLQNGDAHLKNFGVVYSSATDIRLAPIYDVVSTTAYIKEDIQALTLLGSKRWRGEKHLERFAIEHCQLTLKQARSAIKECVGAINWLHEEVDALMDKVEKNTTRETLLQHFKALIVRALKDFE
ncbi:serine/threonine-protein kinase HipA [uncultured Thiomicrorhabdus sp.]